MCTFDLVIWLIFVFNFVLWFVYIFCFYRCFILRRLILTSFIRFIRGHLNVFFGQQQFFVWYLTTRVDAFLAYWFDLIWIIIWLIHPRVGRILENWSSFPTVISIWIIRNLFRILKCRYHLWVYLSMMIRRLYLLYFILLKLVQDR